MAAKRNAGLTRRRVIGGVTLGASVIFAPATAQAATFTVNDLGDPGDGTCDASCTLRDAITEANGAAGHDDVTFQAGLSGTISLYNGEIPITEDITIAGPGADQITVNAGGNSRIFNADLPNANYGDPVSISGLTLTGGYVVGFGAYGAAIASNHANLTVADADVRGNFVYAKYIAVGGGIAAVAGPLTITDSIVADNGAYAHNTNLDEDANPVAIAEGGGIANKYSPVLLNKGKRGVPSGSQTTVTGSTIRNNEAIAKVDAQNDFGFEPSLAFGGGSFNKYSDAAFTESDVRQNIAHAGGFTIGGGITHKYGHDLTVSDSTLKHNLASADSFTNGPGSAGGGIAAKYRNLALAESKAKGVIAPPAVTITGSTINANVATGYSGGVATNGPEVHVDDSKFTDNLATRTGGGIDVGNTPGFNDPEVTITDSVFAGNSAGKYGGAIALSNPGGATLIQRTTLSHGYADDDGAGLFIGSAEIANNDAPKGGGGPPPTAVTVDSSTIDTNAAGNDGGGIAIDDPDDAVLVSDSTISGNTADHHGGGIASYNRSDVPVTVQNSTVAENAATGSEGGGPNAGGGIYRFGSDNDDYAGDDSILLSSTIVANNSQSDLGEAADASGAFDTRFSLVEDDDSASVNDLGDNIFGADPNLGPLHNNGGPTRTQLQSASSPVVNAGDDNGLAKDQRGKKRVVGPAADIGAVELSRLAVVPGSCHQANANEIIGTPHDDDLKGTSGPDAVLALGGNDILHGRRGNDCLFGQAGKDQLFGASGADLLEGGSIGDFLDGGPGADTLKGGGGADTLKGRDGNDLLLGGVDRDTIRGNARDDSIRGGPGNDTLSGDRGNDTVRGGPGDDILRGNKGFDTLICGAGNDTAFVNPGDIVKPGCEHIIGHL